MHYNFKNISLNINLKKNALTIYYTTKDSEWWLQLLAKVTGILESFEHSIIKSEDEEHDHYHEDGDNRDIDHEHIQFPPGLEMAKILDCLEKNEVISAAERREILPINNEEVARNIFFENDDITLDINLEDHVLTISYPKKFEWVRNVMSAMDSVKGVLQDYGYYQIFNSLINRDQFILPKEIMLITVLHALVSKKVISLEEKDLILKQHRVISSQLPKERKLCDENPKEMGAEVKSNSQEKILRRLSGADVTAEEFPNPVLSARSKEPPRSLAFVDASNIGLSDQSDEPEPPSNVSALSRSSSC
jgi:hypothetical protein